MESVNGDSKVNSVETPEVVLKYSIPETLRRPVLIRSRVLMSAGPATPAARVTEVLSKPIMGLHNAETYQIMDEIKEGLKYFFQTTSPITFCSSGSGSSAMETVLINLLEEGDEILIGVIGSFGQRAVDIATRCGAKVRVLESKLGTSLLYEQIRAHVETHKPKLLFLVHGDSSTGVLQTLHNIGDVCRRNDCIFIVDAVSTLGVVELCVDAWKIDAAFSASQKTLGAPAGLAPITFGPRAWSKVLGRKTKVKSYFFDAVLLSKCWGCTDEPRFPHHTISAPILYGLREALADIIEQGTEGFRQKHLDNFQYLCEGLQAIGLELFVEKPEERLPTITSVRIPHGVKWPVVSDYLMQRYSLELSAGFGITEGLIFRIGILNANATHQKVDFVLRALYDGLKTTSNYIAPRPKIYY